MIEQWYAVKCDGCGVVIKNYKNFKPKVETLRTDGVIYYQGQHFCSKCCFYKVVRGLDTATLKGNIEDDIRRLKEDKEI